MADTGDHHSPLLMTTYTRLDMASIWWTGLTDQEQRAITEAAEDHLGITPGLPPPTVLECWELFNAGTITLTPQGRP